MIYNQHIVHVIFFNCFLIFKLDLILIDFCKYRIYNIIIFEYKHLVYFNLVKTQGHIHSQLLKRLFLSLTFVSNALS